MVSVCPNIMFEGGKVKVVLIFYNKWKIESIFSPYYYCSSISNQISQKNKKIKIAMECCQLPAVYDCFQYTKISYLKGFRCLWVSSARKNYNFRVSWTLFLPILHYNWLCILWKSRNSTFDLGCLKLRNFYL